MQMVMGNIHIHSTYSDGSSDIAQIARAAAKSGLDFIIITDHQTLAGLGEEGYHEGVLVLCGSEINIKKHHYLALDIKKQVPDNDNNPQAVIDAVNDQEGFGFIAHPYETGSPLVLDGITYPWQDWDVHGYAGIEVWNWSSQWRDGVKNIWQGLYYAYLNPEGPITGPCRQAMARFDRITCSQKITAIAGSDAHDYHIRRGPIRRRIFPYEYLFGTANNCLLLPDPPDTDAERAKAQIYKALRLGRSFIVNCKAGLADGFSFIIRNNNQTAQMGDTIQLNGKTELQVSSKCRHIPQLTVVRNGKPIQAVKAKELQIRLTGPGTYRVELRLKNKPWIFTNPIYVIE